MPAAHFYFSSGNDTFGTLFKSANSIYSRSTKEIRTIGLISQYQTERELDAQLEVRRKPKHKSITIR